MIIFQTSGPQSRPARLSLFQQGLNLFVNSLAVLTELFVKHLERSRITEMVATVNLAVLTNQTAEVD